MIGAAVPGGFHEAHGLSSVAVWKRYIFANGNLLAAGVAYFAFFSIIPAMTLAFAVFGFILQGRPDVLQSLVDSVNEAFPGMVKTAETPTGIISIEVPSSLTLTLTGIISFLTLLLAGLGWVSALRTGIRGLFGLRPWATTSCSVASTTSLPW